MFYLIQSLYLPLNIFYDLTSDIFLSKVFYGHWKTALVSFINLALRSRPKKLLISINLVKRNFLYLRKILLFYLRYRQHELGS